MACTRMSVCTQKSLAAALPKSDVSRGRKGVNDAAASERIFFRRMQKKITYGMHVFLVGSLL